MSDTRQAVIAYLTAMKDYEGLAEYTKVLDNKNKNKALTPAVVPPSVGTNQTQKYYVYCENPDPSPDSRSAAIIIRADVGLTDKMSNVVVHKTKFGVTVVSVKGKLPNELGISKSFTEYLYGPKYYGKHRSENKESILDYSSKLFHKVK